MALRRGPLVYCIEQVDNRDTPLGTVSLPREAGLKPMGRMDLFDGIVTIEAEGRHVTNEGWKGVLYRSAPPTAKPVTLTAIPYYLWANRGGGQMSVWINEN